MAGTVPATRARAKAIARQLKDQPRALIAEAIRLASDGQDALGFELLRATPAAVAHMTPAQIHQFLPLLYDWKSTDAFGSFISGPAWRHGVLTDRHIAAWTRSPHLWTRRAALVSTVPLNLPARGATAPHGEPARTLAICRLLIDDHEDMIVKALSWALRTLATKAPKPVKAFLTKHRPRLAARVLRETNNKLSTGLKNPRHSERVRRTS